ncbi:MAG: hypothetical protein ACK4WK_10585 [Anaerolineae bacterium]
MPDRISARCPHCGQPNTYRLADLEQTHPVAKGGRALRPTPAPEPQEYIVTCRHCYRAFKVTAPRGLPDDGGAP